MFGYMGKLLFVNLSTGATEVRDLDEQDARNFLGGYGLGAKILYDEMPAKADPLGEDSVLGFVTGAVNGTGVLFGGRFMVVHKSPVTGGWNDANCGGDFGPALKKAGFDAVFVKGVAKKPVSIFIDEGKAEIVDADDLWGKTITECEETIAVKYGDKAKSALIGPAGEKISLIASIMNDGHRAAGRGGCGAVMGSKKLKAVIARGDLEVPVADKAKINEHNLAVVNHMKGPGIGFANMFGNFGTGAGYVGSTQSGDAGVKNWGGSGVTDYPADVATPVGSQGIDNTKTKKYACANCPLGCGAFHNYPDDRWDLTHSPRPEYETMGAFGSLCLNKDAASIFRANDLCNDYGTDTISTGSTVAWAMECYENGVLTKDELDGIELTWGNGDAIVAITEKLVKGEGCGKILMLGSQAAADKFGKGHEYLVVASGIEEPQHDGRLAYGLTRTYQYDPTPGRHVKGGIGQFITHVAGHSIDYKGTGYQDLAGIANTEVNNSSGFCLFGANNPPGSVKAQVEYATGFKYSTPEWVALGVRIYNMRHAFNIREGLRRKDFTMSSRMYDTKPPHDGPIAGNMVDHELLADNFFNAMGWTMDMVPVQQILRNLGGLDKVLADLYPPPPPPPPPPPADDKK
ncbi:MAG: aldehyde ferredoxin oxidoreductase family protein [Peptococcaceae bacterium]|jgi:aldehyde:ferredoxin oxidoreductase|nr:aldehyde ferredoxin oxidoreductase family protein [Peptococcaceae bacterium]